jgi:hypothetical protein
MKNIKLIKNLNYIENNKLRIALCISGKIDDNIEELYISWKEKLLNYYKVDIFMNINETNDFIENVIKPKKCVVFNKNIEFDNFLDKYSNLMFYRIYECNKYSIDYENKYNFKYDIIIRIRTDIILYDNLYLSNFKDDFIYFPIIKDKIDIYKNGFGLGITDQFFLGNRNNMNKLCDIYLYLKSNYLNIDCKLPEITLYYYLNKKNINIAFFYYNWVISYYIYSKNVSLKNIILNKYKIFNKIFLIKGSECYINL